MGPEALQKKFEEESSTYMKLQKEIAKTHERRSQLDAQLNENNLVKSEMDLLEPTDVVFKLIGPALIRQDTAEAQASVNKRLDYINGEIKRHESAGERLAKDQEAQRQKMEAIHQQVSKMAQAAKA